MLALPPKANFIIIFSFSKNTVYSCGDQKTTLWGQLCPYRVFEFQGSHSSHLACVTSALLAKHLSGPAGVCSAVEAGPHMVAHAVLQVCPPIWLAWNPKSKSKPPRLMLVLSQGLCLVHNGLPSTENYGHLPQAELMAILIPRKVFLKVLPD